MIFANPRFWGMAVFSALFLTMAGLGLARALLPPPLNFYHTSYMSLVIPAGWGCWPEAETFMCGLQNPDLAAEGEAPRRDAVIIFAAKITGEQDSFDVYLDHLKTPRQFVDADDNPGESVVEHVGDRMIAGRRGIVASHLHSEVRDYRTLYYATTTRDISVLVTFSAHRKYDHLYTKDVEKTLANLSMYKPVRSRQVE